MGRYLTLRTLTALLGLAALAWVGRCAAGHLVDNSGDVAIYWVYAKSMWTEGFFHYGPAGVRHGASSPLWAFFLSLLHPIAGERFLVYKLAALAFMFLAAFGVWRLGRALGLPTQVAFGAGLLLAGSSFLQKYAACGFETPLFVALLVFAALATLRLTEGAGRPAVWAALVGFLPLARPEGAMFAGVFVVWVIAATRGRFLTERRGWLWILAAALPVLLFYGWMYAATGSAVPSSVAGRYARHALQDTYQDPVSTRTIINQCLGAGYLGYHSMFFILAWNTLVAVGLVSLFRRRPVATVALTALPVLLTAALLWKNPGHYYTRYGLSVLPIGIVFVAIGGVATARALVARAEATGAAHARSGAWVVVAALTALFLWLPVTRLHEHTEYSRKVKIDNVLDRVGSKSLNEALPENARLLVYEIQTQYLVEAVMFSADGIVGGEILPYLYEKDVIGFIRDHDISHVLVSEAYDYRSTFHGTVLHDLWRIERNASLKDRVVFERDGLRFVREANRIEGTKLPHWEGVYAVYPTSLPEAG